MSLIEKEGKTFSEVLSSAFGMISHMSPGDRAALRRGVTGSAYWRVWEGAGIYAGGEAHTQNWSRLIQAMAIFVGTSGAQKSLTRDSLGTAIASAGISEGRFEKMITAPIEIRHELLDRIVRQIAKDQSRINIQDLASLYLEEEPSRLRDISRSFYKSSSL
ncbi:MAG: type I-E CRISPR-associated protein Cse2/CasB [Roseibium sp.]|uniref:type I-E CRISPR-associated protein Cse2/CasB n=1 Tax=Roseibium sp. TaxID=1936156 RepID=UPI003297DF2C